MTTKGGVSPERESKSREEKEGKNPPIQDEPILNILKHMSKTNKNSQ